MPRSREPEPTPVGDRDSRLDHLRCVWKSSGRRCYLQGEMSPHIGERIPYYCHWHYVCLTSTQFADDFQEFERWAKRLEVYCSVENHYPLDEVWSAIQGICAIRGMPHRCKAWLCKHSELVMAPRRDIAEVYRPECQKQREREAGVITTERSSTQISREEVERQKRQVLGLDQKPVPEEVPF